MERKLAAIFAADVVGYGRLMERDEAGTFGRLRAHRKELFEPEIDRHHGRIFKLMGDGLLAEFGSVVDAVECAVVLQREMAERNNGLPDDQRIDVRIGVHLGDVIIEGDDRHGDAVNIASRLQQLAERGGICVSETVAKHVARKVAVAFEPVGKHKVKNITEPVGVSRVLMEAVPARVRRGRHSNVGYAAAALVVLLVAGAGVAWYLREPTETATEPPAKQSLPATVPTLSEPVVTQRSTASAELDTKGQPAAFGPTEAQPAQLSNEGIPVIVVLPFEDLTGDQVRSDLGKGIAEAFITDVSTFPDFEVVSSTTSFTLSDKTVPEIVKETGATFVVEGSIRRAGDKAMITMQLIRGSTDRHLKIAQLEEKMTDPVTLQSAVASRIREELGGMTGVFRKEYDKIALAKADADLTEYDYYVLGHIHAFRGEGSAARDVWASGLKRYPESVLMRYKLMIYYLYFEGATAPAEQLMREAATLKKKSQLDEWYFHWLSGALYSAQGDHKRAVAEAKAAIAMAPYDTLSRENLSRVLSAAGLKDEALEWMKFAVTNDPNPIGWYFDDLLNAYSATQKWPDALELAEAEIRDNPSPSKYWYQVMGRAYSATGQQEKAKEAYDKFESLPDPPEQ
jgi:class 3 adenylate cyclase/TolB-like protein